MILEIIDKNIFNIITLPNNLAFICRFKDHNLVFCSLCKIHEISDLTKIWFVKTSARKAKYESGIVKSNPDI